MNINYFILTYQGLSIFENNYDKNLNNEVNLNIIDNGNQTSKKFENFIIHKTKQNIGCAGGWNLICLIAFNFLKLEKIIIGQDDANVSIELLKPNIRGSDLNSRNLHSVSKNKPKIHT